MAQVLLILDLNDWLHNGRVVPGMDLLAVFERCLHLPTVSFWLRIINALGGLELVESGIGLVQ